MNRTARVGWGCTVVAAVALAVSVPVMAKRLSTRADLKDRPIVWFQGPLNEESLVINGTPLELRIVDDAPGVEGGRAIRIEWRGDTIDVPLLGSDDPRKPGLARFEDWFAVLPMFQGRGSRQADVVEQIESGAAKPRVIIAARLPAEGLDPGSWGTVQRQNSRYRFIELLEGTPEDHTHEVTQRTYSELDAIFAPGPHSPHIDITREERDAIRWQYDAMLQVTPAAQVRARSKIVQVAMQAMGWTWPVASGGILLLIVGLVLVAASRLSPPEGIEACPTPPPNPPPSPRP